MARTDPDDIFRFPTLTRWLRDAQSTSTEAALPGGEDVRADAVRLLFEYERRQVKSGGPRDAAVLSFLADEMERVRLDPDPLQALARLMGAKRGRGRPTADAHKFEQFAIEVYSLVQDGLTITEALERTRNIPGAGFAMAADYAEREYQKLRADPARNRKLKAAYAMRMERDLSS